MNREALRAARSQILTEWRLALFKWSGEDVERARLVRRRSSDISLTLLAGVLPWSTSGGSVLIFASAVLILSTIPPDEYRVFPTRLAARVPLLLFLLAIVGTAWAVGVPWVDRFVAVEKVSKLLMIPLLLYHSRRSDRALWVFGFFVASNVLLMVYSFVIFFQPDFAFHVRYRQEGVPVKNYIDQSQAFSFCAVALAAFAIELAKKRLFVFAALIFATSAAFLLNMAFVNVARVTFIYLPVLFLLLAFRYLSARWRAAALVFSAIVAISLASMSPILQEKLSSILTEYKEIDASLVKELPGSVGTRLEYWKKSLIFFRSDPFFGHGTGSTRMLFERAAINQSGFAALITSNPHNQILAVGIQWGIVGCALLCAIWISHYYLFRGPGYVSLLGALLVVQNVVSSLFNSHLFDFYEGWLYVLGVGICGGLCVHVDRSRRPAGPAFFEPSGLPAGRLEPENPLPS